MCTHEIILRCKGKHRTLEFPRTWFLIHLVHYKYYDNFSKTILLKQNFLKNYVHCTISKITGQIYLNFILREFYNNKL